jgi:hypothetical protein
VLPGRPSAIDRTLGAFERTRARISAPDGHNCVRTQILQNWPKHVKSDFVDLRDSFP